MPPGELGCLGNVPTTSSLSQIHLSMVYGLALAWISLLKKSQRML